MPCLPALHDLGHYLFLAWILAHPNLCGWLQAIWNMYLLCIILLLLHTYSLQKVAFDESVAKSHNTVEVMNNIFGQRWGHQISNFVCSSDGTGTWGVACSQFQTTRHGNLKESCMTPPSSEGALFGVVTIMKWVCSFLFSTTHSSLKDLLPKFNKCADTFLEKLRPYAGGKREAPMKEAFHEAALDVISKV